MRNRRDRRDRGDAPPKVLCELRVLRGKTSSFSHGYESHSAVAATSAVRRRGKAMRMRKLVLTMLLVSTGTLWAADFLTEGVDNGRTGWVKDEKVFTTANVASMKLLWK